MRTHTLLLLAAALAAGACNKGNNPTPTNGAATQTEGRGTPVPALLPEHGGVVSASAGLTTELVAQPDGKLVTYVRGPQGAVQDADVRVTVRNPDGTTKPVAVAWDAQQSAYVGYVWGIQPGTKTVDVAVAAQGDAPAQTVSTPNVSVPAVATPPAARYGGSVEIIGEYAVEVVPSRSGDVAFFVMDMQGNPLPASEVSLPRVTLATAAGAGPAPAVPAAPTTVVGTTAAAAAGVAPGAPGVVAAVPSVNVAVLVPRPVGDHFVAHAEPAALADKPSVGFDVDLTVHGHRFTHGCVPSATVVAAMPPTVQVAVPAAPTVQVGGAVAANPTVGAGVQVNVGVAAPPPPTVVIGAPPAVVVEAPPPVILPPSPPVVLVNGGAVAAPPRVGVAVQAGVVAPPPPRVGVAVQAGVVAPPPPAVVVHGGVRGGAVIAGPYPAGAVPAAPARPVVAAPAGRAQGSVGVGVRVGIPQPPPPPAVRVQGGFSVGGSFGIH